MGRPATYMTVAAKELRDGDWIEGPEEIEHIALIPKQRMLRVLFLSGDYGWFTPDERVQIRLEDGDEEEEDADS